MLNYIDIAKTLIQDAEKKGIDTHFDFSNMEKLGEQLEELFTFRRRGSKESLKNVAEYIKKAYGGKNG
jgi:hypothetical protein